ncbi:MAG: LytR/AlgR family response regulator transcription factor [Chitinophagales bacterium]
MQKYKCLIVEDEPLAAEVLQDYIHQIGFLELRGICQDAIYAADALQKEIIDLIFLDIHLPRLKGIDFIRTLQDPPQIIITSAYPDYALDGYDLEVMDYLLKPVEFSRFLTAVNKLPARNWPVLSHKRQHLFFFVQRKKVKVFLDEILYVESQKEYIRIITKSKTILTKFSLGELERLLEKDQFLRVHRSFIVAKDKIDAFTSTDIEVKDRQIPIGRNYRDLVVSALD